MAGRRPKAPGTGVTENVSARLTTDERDALEQLLSLRAAEMEERGEPGDDTFAGWLRWMIRREAKAKRIAFGDAPPHVLSSKDGARK